jgi:hypothetical protein
MCIRLGKIPGRLCSSNRWCSSRLFSPAAAQKKEREPVVISFGQPNIWSLEQTHYLHAHMHRT